MAVPQNSNNLSPEEIQAILNEKAALQKQVEMLRAESDSYRRALQSLAGRQITEEILQGRMAERQVEGTLLDFIEEVRQEK